MISTSLLLTVLIFGQLAKPSLAERENPVYTQLRAEGLMLDGKRIELPPPSMPSNRTEAQEKAILKEIVKRDLELSDFILPAINAPHILVSSESKTPGGIIWRYDVWFVVYAPLKALDVQEKAKDPGQQAVESGGVTIKTAAVPEKVLSDLRLEAEKGSGKDESFWFETSNLFDLVEVQSTSRVFTVLDDRALVIATRTDPRFNANPKFANQWRGIADGKKKPAVPFEGGGGYSKATQLETVKGALLVESHFVYFEAKGWSDAGSLLDGKIPVVAKNQIQKLRDDLAAKFPLPEPR